MLAKLITCETVWDELQHLVPDDMPRTILEFGLHNTPDRLHDVLQQAVDETKGEVDTILFGYGMCSKGTLGLQSRRFSLVIPKVDDCIALFLGSRAEYQRQSSLVPGTFYLTRGWIECGDDPYTEYLKMAEKYGEKKALQLEKMYIGNYTRLALIDTGHDNMAHYRAYAAMQADFFDLQLEELVGSSAMLHKMLRGNWDEDFVVVGPGQTVQYSMFVDGLDS